MIMMALNDFTIRKCDLHICKVLGKYRCDPLEMTIQTDHLISDT